MDKLEIIKKSLTQDKERLILSVERAKIARDSASSAMESHHDTERNQNEKMVAALEEELIKIESLLQKLPKVIKNNSDLYLWKEYEITQSGKKLRIILVPDGYGGREIDGVMLVSINTNIGQKLKQKNKYP